MRAVGLLALLAACDGVFGLEPVPIDAAGTGFDPCVPLAIMSWRYSLYDATTSSIDNAAAQAACTQRGLTLVVINTPEESSFILTTFGSKRSWTGLRRIDASTWGGDGSCSTTPQFRTGQGLNLGLTCAAQQTDGLQDLDCNTTLEFAICEQARPQVSGCSAPFHANRYRIVVPTPITHDTAALACSATEHLLSINTADEQAGVDGLAAASNVSSYWLAGSYDPASSSWTGTGECPPYYAWGPQQPTFGSGEQFVIRATGLGTQAATPTAAAGVICEAN